MSENKRIFDQLDRVEGRLDSIDVTLAKNTTSLEDHMRRTNLLEEAVAPLTKDKAQRDGAFKLLGVLSLMGGVATGLLKVFEYFFK